MTCTAFGPPWLLARRAAAVQEISGGRLVLGLGAGWNETEFRAFGIPLDHRATRFIDAFERVLRAALPHVDGWNIWYDWFGNTPAGFARENERVTAILRDAGRAPGEVWRSATVLLVLDGHRSDRPISAATPPVTGSADRIVGQLRSFADAGVDEAILVVSPITERSIRELAPVVAALT